MASKKEKVLSKEDEKIIDSLIDELQEQTRISQVDKWDGEEIRAWLDNGGDIINFKPVDDKKIKAEYRVEIGTQVRGTKKKADKIHAELEKQFKDSDCDDVRYDDYGEFVQITVSCKNDRNIDKSDFNLEDPDPNSDEFKREADNLLDDMRNFKSENREYVKEVLNRYEDDEDIESDNEDDI